MKTAKEMHYVLAGPLDLILQIQSVKKPVRTKATLQGHCRVITLITKKLENIS